MLQEQFMFNGKRLKSSDWLVLMAVAYQIILAACLLEMFFPSNP
jgi:hypothetical protein